MKPDTIRLLDSWLGKPLCLLLTLLRRLLVLAGLERLPNRPEKILFVKLVEQGALVLAWNALQEAIARVGRDNVYFLIFQENRPLLDILGVIPDKNIFAIRQDRLTNFLYDTASVLLRIRRARIDTVLDLEFFSRASAVLAFLTGAPCRVGHHRFTSEVSYRGDLLTHRVSYNPHLHTAVSLTLLVRALDLNPGDLPLTKCPAPEPAATRPEFRAHDEEKDRVKRLLVTAFSHEPSRPIVLLNPNASDLVPLRRWEDARFVQLGRQVLSQMPTASIVVTGAKSERQAGEALSRAINSHRAASLAGETTLRELLVLYTLSDLLVTNDSGPAHFASLTEIRTIVLFGPETPLLYRPLGPRVHVLWAGLACSPCVSVYNQRRSPCRDNLCMKAISVKQVLDELRTCLS